MIVQIARYGWIETTHITNIDLKTTPNDARFTIHMSMVNGTTLQPPVEFVNEDAAITWLQMKGILSKP